ncbi:hypothetical protein HDE_05257 [Halotydeus destructor]|nr:hypothetical protein HDE_05257 [Halotydeus destructor]
MTNTWTSIEVNEAVRAGYRLVDIIQVLHYKVTGEDLFSKYIEMWLKIKQQASDWPADVVTEEEKQQYIIDYLRKEGVELEANMIDRNEASRFIAKIFLNSFWGQLSQLPEQPMTELITDADTYLTLLNDDKKCILGKVCVNNNCLMVTWQIVDDTKGRIGKTNIAVASFDTAHARLEPYRLLARIERQREGSLLDFDT